MPSSLPFQQGAAATCTCKMGKDLVLYMREAVYQSITMRRMICVGALIYGH